MTRRDLPSPYRVMVGIFAHSAGAEVGPGLMQAGFSPADLVVGGGVSRSAAPVADRLSGCLSQSVVMHSAGQRPQPASLMKFDAGVPLRLELDVLLPTTPPGSGRSPRLSRSLAVLQSARSMSPW